MKLDEPCEKCGCKTASWMDYGDGEFRLTCDNLECGDLLEIA